MMKKILIYFIIMPWKIIKLEKLRIKGSAIIFPSYIYHQVTPVTKGERLSIVIWFNGEKWR